MKKLMETDKAEIRYNPQTNAIELIWKTFVDGTTYKSMFIKGVEYLAEYGATSWLSDIRKEGVVGPEYSKWLQNEIIPKAIANGLKRIAVVMDSDIFKRFYVKNIESNLTQNGRQMMQYFDSIEEANAWLSMCAVEI